MDQADEADGQVAQGGHDLGAVSGAQLVAVLIEDHVPDPVEPVLDSLVPLDPGRNLLGLSLLHRQRADQVDHLNGCPLGLTVLARTLTVPGGSRAPDLKHLSRLREVDPGGSLDRLDGTSHPPPARGVNARDGRDVLPGKPLERPAHTGLVVLNSEHVVTTSADDPLGGACLGVHRIGAHHRPAQVEGLEKLPECRDLVGLVGYPHLGQHDTGGLVQGRQEVRRRGLPQAGPAHGLAIHRDDCSSLDGAGASAVPGP